MPTVQHPALSQVSLEVSGDKISEHLEQGWILVPETAGEDPESEPAPPPRRRKR